MGERTIDIRDIVYAIKKRYKLVLIITLLCTLGGAYIGLFTKDISYQARVKIFVGKEENVQSVYTNDEITRYNSVLQAYIEIMRTDDLLNNALKSSGLDMTASQVKGGLSFIPSENAPIIEIRYTSNNAETAKKVVESVSSEFSNQVKEVVLNAYSKVIETAKVSAIYPNKTQPIIISFLLGIMLSMGIILVLLYLDNTIKHREQLEKVLPIPVIGEIPIYHEE